MDPAQAAQAVSGGLPWSVAVPAFVAMAAAIVGLWKYSTSCERRGDALEKAFREHLEHDARLFRGERDRRAEPHHTTGKHDLDESRAATESISRQIPPEVMARIRSAIDRHEDPFQ